MKFFMKLSKSLCQEKKSGTITFVVHCISQLNEGVSCVFLQIMDQRCLQFCKSFSVAPSLSKYVRAIWMLDHGYYKVNYLPCLIIICNMLTVDCCLHACDWVGTFIISDNFMLCQKVINNNLRQNHLLWCHGSPLCDARQTLIIFDRQSVTLTALHGSLL